MIGSFYVNLFILKFDTQVQKKNNYYYWIYIYIKNKNWPMPGHNLLINW